MLGGVLSDWSKREWLRGIQGDEGSSIKFPSTNYPRITMFATDLGNCVPSSLFPRVTGNHAKAVYSLDSAVGTITQSNNHSFDRSFNGEGPYPTNQRVSDLALWDSLGD